MAEASKVFKGFFYLEEASVGSQCWCWGAVRTLHPQTSDLSSPTGPLQSRGARWLLGPCSGLSFQPQQLWSLNPKPLCAAGVPLVSAGRSCGGREGCPRRSLGDLPWGPKVGRARFYSGSGNGDGTEGRVPAGAQVDPGLQAGAWLRGLCLKVSLPQPDVSMATRALWQGLSYTLSPPQPYHPEGDVPLS